MPHASINTYSPQTPIRCHRKLYPIPIYVLYAPFLRNEGEVSEFNLLDLHNMNNGWVGSGGGVVGG